MRSIRRVLLSGILLLLYTSAAFALVVAKRDFPDLVARAEQIVAGTVIDVSEGKDDNGVRHTLVSVVDLTVLKGSVDGPHLTLKLAGGLSGETTSRILDLPVFRPGERYVLFVAGNGRVVCPLVGVWQGRFPVHFDKQRGVDVINADDGQHVLGRAKRELRLAPTEAGQSTLSLDEFRALIADELAHPTVSP